MDINYLLHREQVEIVHADGAKSLEVETAHRQMAALYRAQINEYRDGHYTQDGRAIPLSR